MAGGAAVAAEGVVVGGVVATVPSVAGEEEALVDSSVVMVATVIGWLVRILLMINQLVRKERMGGSAAMISRLLGLPQFQSLVISKNIFVHLRTVSTLNIT